MDGYVSRRKELAKEKIDGLFKKSVSVEQMCYNEN